MGRPEPPDGLPYSVEELIGRLVYCRERKEPSLRQIARMVGISPNYLYKLVGGKEKMSNVWQRILTDFFHKWDAGIYVLDEERKLRRTRNPRPRITMRVDFGQGAPTLSFRPPAQPIGMPKPSWVENAALSRMELLESSVSLSVSRTGRLKVTKKSVP